MRCYITYGEFQECLKDYYERTGSKLQTPEMAHYLLEKHHFHTRKNVVKIPDGVDHIPHEEFEKINNALPIDLTELTEVSVQKIVSEKGMIPSRQDVFTIRHPRYTRCFEHIHDYFEINYVASGTGIFYFEGETHSMREGEVCLIAPGSSHDFQISDDSIVYTISIRKSAFNTTFFHLMSHKNLLSYFFRMILQGDGQPNYLMFYTKNNIRLTGIVRSLLIESCRTDTYSAIASNSLVSLFFSLLLRDYSQTIRFYNYEMGADFSLVLQYVQHNYRTLTLSSLAEFFHYSEPYLCTLIKKNTGHTFSGLIRELKMNDAVRFLTDSDLKIGEIAEIVGYNSADHFSRVFRNAYHISPQDYRKQHADSA